MPSLSKAESALIRLCWIQHVFPSRVLRDEMGGAPQRRQLFIIRLTNKAFYAENLFVKEQQCIRFLAKFKI